MYLLTRSLKGVDIVHNLGLFDTEESALSYQRACEPLHRTVKYTYEISRLPYFKGYPYNGK